MLVVLKFKLTGVPEDDFSAVSDHIQNHLHIRVQDKEEKLSERYPFRQFSKYQSSENSEFDTFMITMQVTEQFIIDSLDQVQPYPFDKQTFEWDFQLCNFEINDNTYRFDYYKLKDLNIFFEPRFNSVSELCLEPGDHSHFVEPQRESKTYENMDCFYYPGFTIKLHTHRHPFTFVFRLLLPIVIISVFVSQTYWIEQFEVRFPIITICILAYVLWLDQLRFGVPKIPQLTSSDWFYCFWCIMSCLPLVDECLRLIPMSINEQKHTVQ